METASGQELKSVMTGTMLTGTDVEGIVQELRQDFDVQTKSQEMLEESPISVGRSGRMQSTTTTMAVMMGTHLTMTGAIGWGSLSQDGGVITGVLLI